MRPKRSFIPNLRAGLLLERFLISAIAAILLIRLYLYLTGFPQVGGKGLHIAHMLWGGLLMLAAIVVFIGFLDRGSHAVAAVLGGAGFGIFLDELGKFLTSNNNYFFRPAVAIMYVIFVLLYLLFDELSKQRPVSETAYLLNAMAEIQAGLLHRDGRHRVRATRYLQRGDAADPAVIALTDLVDTLPSGTEIELGPLRRLTVNTRRALDRLTQRESFERVMMGVMLLAAAGWLAEGIAVTAVMTHRLDPAAYIAGIPHLSFSQAADLITSVISGALIVAGLFTYLWARLLAFRLLRLGVLVSILLTQIFLFNLIQFWALIGFAVNILFLAALNEMTRQEVVAGRTRRRQPTAAVPSETS